MQCPFCQAQLPDQAKFCESCGQPIPVGPYSSSGEAEIAPELKKGYMVVLDERIKAEMQRVQFNPKWACRTVARRKWTIGLIFALLYSLLTAAFFFRLLNYVLCWVLLLVSLVIMGKLQGRQNTRDFLIKEIKARPDDDISYIVAEHLYRNQAQPSLLLRRAGIFTVFVIVLAIVLTSLFFIHPHMIFEKADDGYALRFYTSGWFPERQVTVPATYKGEPVTELRGDVFAELWFMQELSLPDSLKRIRGAAFANSWSLRTIRMPKHLEYLGGSAFSGCKKLRKVDLEGPLTELGGETFKQCEDLQAVTIPRTVKRIGGECFSGCKELRAIDLPPGLTEIRGETFRKCSSLEEIVIPAGVTRIGSSAFRGCSLLRTVQVPDSLREIGRSAFRDCSRLKEIVIPERTILGEKAFGGSSPTWVKRR